MWYNIIKERKVLKMRKPRLSETTIKKLYNGETATSGKYEYEFKTEYDDDYNAYGDYLYRWDEENNYERWEVPAEGLWAFEK